MVGRRSGGGKRWVGWWWMKGIDPPTPPLPPLPLPKPIPPSPLNRLWHPGMNLMLLLNDFSLYLLFLLPHEQTHPPSSRATAAFFIPLALFPLQLYFLLHFLFWAVFLFILGHDSNRLSSPPIFNHSLFLMTFILFSYELMGAVVVPQMLA